MQSEVRPKRGRFQSLGWRILFWMALIALGPMMVMAVQGYHCAREALVASEEAHLQSVLGARQARLESWLSQVQADLRFLDASPCVRGICGDGPQAGGAGHCAAACNLLDDLRAGSTYYTALATYDRDWNALIATSNPLPPGARPGDPDSGRVRPEPGLRDSLQSTAATVITPPRLSPTGRLTAQIGRRFTPRPGAQTAFLVADLDISGSVDPIFLDRTGLGRSGRCFLVTGAGRYPRETVAAGAGRLPGDLPLRAGEMHVGRYRDPRGVPVLGTSTRIAPLKAQLVVQIDEAEAFAWLRRLRDRALATGLVTLGLVLLVAVRGARSLARPLRELARVSRRIARGQADERVGPLTGPEAEDVAEAFNRMIDELNATHRRLLRAASLAAIGELSSSVVHEMRNPLSSIKMNLQALAQKVAGDPPHAELAAIASQQVARLETMLSELLGYGKPLVLEPAEIHFADLARDVAEVARTAAEARGVSLEIEDHLGGRPLVADPEQIRRALTNLVINAIQAAPQDGRVELAAAIPAENPDLILLRVRDNGGGIPAGKEEEIFQPFFTTRAAGTGLGLANVKKIVDYHGGRVFARNHAVGGAEFGILLSSGGPNGAPAGRSEAECGS